MFTLTSSPRRIFTPQIPAPAAWADNPAQTSHPRTRAGKTSPRITPRLVRFVHPTFQLMAGLMPPEDVSIISISRSPSAVASITYCLANRFLHSTQAKGFSAEWARLCRLRCSERVKTLSQMSHFMSCILGSSAPPGYCGEACTPPAGSRSDMVGGLKMEPSAVSSMAYSSHKYMARSLVSWALGYQKLTSEDASGLSKRYVMARKALKC